MSGITTGRVFWTPLKELSYTGKNGKVVKIKETTAKIVLLAIADSSNDFGENSWQSFETIAKKASIERRSVIRVVRALISHDYMKVDGVTEYGTNKFTINLDKLGNPPKKRDKVGRPKIGDSDAEIGDPDANNGDSGVKTSDPPSPNPLKNRRKSSLKSNGAPATPKATDIPELVLFREVVSHWPKQAQRDIVISAIQRVNQRLGRLATKDDLVPFWLGWAEVSGNEWSLKWLTEWATSGRIGNNNGKVNHANNSTSPQPVYTASDYELAAQIRAQRGLS